METKELFVRDKYAIAITSMCRVRKKIYLGLTGGANILAVYDVESGEISLKQNIFPWIKERGYCSKIHNSMGILSDGSIVMGEGNHFTWDGIPVTVNYFNKELPESMLARKRRQGYPEVKYTDFCLQDLENWDRSKSDKGGRIIRYYPESGKTENVGFLPEYLYSQSMIVDRKRDIGFGHTIPDNNFFYVDFKAGKIKNFGHISDYAHHNMVITPEGICYGGWIDRADHSLKLLKFDPDKQRLEYLNKIILQDPGSKVAGNQGIDEWIVTRDGRIFMGTVANSLLFEFHWREEEFELVAQLAKGGRVTSMDEDETGTIWMGADYPHMRLVKYDPKRNSVKDFGRVNTSYPRCYFHASCIWDGKLYLGETDGFSPSLHIIDLKKIQGKSHV
ncbi:MAG: hypothetical protein PHH77_05455 [Victivallaceae bacterium]|nr:hypothetical protein [Victivallaceae bacterium]